MAGKEITDLAVTNDFGSGDLISIRKNAQLEDKALSFDNLLKSIGNTAVDGFVSASEETNKIKIDSANGVAVDRYYDGMKVSFVSPITSTGAVQLKIGVLPYKDLYVHKTQDSVVLQLNDYVEAVYITGKFYQVNRTDYVYTNDYKVILVDIDASETFTNIYLSSAFGVTKTSYYEGMSIMFTCPIDTKGVVRVIIDGLAIKDISEVVDDLIYTDLYKDQTILAIYNGQKFIKNTLNATKNLVIPQDIQIVDDQPVESFITLQVGATRTLKKLLDALNQVIVENAKDRGKSYKIVLDSDFTLNEEIMLYDKDLGDTTITSNGAVINCNLVHNQHSIATIFIGKTFKLKFDNIKFKVNGINNISNTSYVFAAMFYPDKYSEIKLNNVSFISTMQPSMTTLLTVFYLGGGQGNDTLTADNITVTGFDDFLRVSSGKVTITNSSLSCNRRAIDVFYNAYCTIENCTIVGACLVRAKVTITNVTFNKTTSSIAENYAISITASGDLSLNQVDIDQYNVGIEMTSGSVLNYTGGSITKFSQYGIMNTGGTGRLTNIIINNSSGQSSTNGVKVLEMGSITLKACSTLYTQPSGTAGSITVLS